MRGGIFLGKWRSSFAGSCDGKMNVNQPAIWTPDRYAAGDVWSARLGVWGCHRHGCLNDVFFVPPLDSNLTLRTRRPRCTSQAASRLHPHDFWNVIFFVIQHLQFFGGINCRTSFTYRTERYVTSFVWFLMIWSSPSTYYFSTFAYSVRIILDNKLLHYKMPYSVIEIFAAPIYGGIHCTGWDCSCMTTRVSGRRLSQETERKYIFQNRQKED
jgi:hypothetical protein